MFELPRVGDVHSLETFLVALLLCAVFLAAESLHALQAHFPRRWLSLAAGVAVAYVFVDILPELGARHRGFVAAAGQGILFAEQRIYLAALLGFLVFYGLEHLVFAPRDSDPPSNGAEATRAAVRLHIGGYALYSWLIGYLLMDRALQGRVSLGVYAAAMALHFAVVGNALVRKHGRTYHRWGRWLLPASILVGWLTGAVAPMAETVISRLFAFVAGGVVMTTMNEELPREREGRFWWFVLGSSGYTLVLLMV